MRVVAHLSKEPVWTEGFMKGQDVHDTTAEAANCTRDEAKTINYAILFGAGTKTIAYGAKCSVARAEEFMDTLKNRATTFLDWKEKQEKHAYEKGFITTLYVRNIYVPEIRSRDNEAAAHGKRQVLSGLVQGSAADMLKVAMLRLRKHGIIPVTTTHDEIGVEVRENEAEDVADIVKYEMENSTVLDVPVLTEVAVGDNWGVK
jgi:DNA polymerase-1